jgi:hypothetical protein
MKQCITVFASNSKTRNGAKITKQLNERRRELKNIADVDRFTKKRENDTDDVEQFLDDDFSSDNLFDADDEPSSSVKRKLQSTLAVATVGKEQEHQDKTKRRHKPAVRLGINAAQKDRHHVNATSSRTYQQNRDLLMIPGNSSNQVSLSPPAKLQPTQIVYSDPLFPVDVSVVPKPATQSDIVSPAPAILGSLASTVIGPPITTVVENTRQQDPADVVQV